MNSSHNKSRSKIELAFFDLQMNPFLIFGWNNDLIIFCLKDTILTQISII